MSPKSRLIYILTGVFLIIMGLLVLIIPQSLNQDRDYYGLIEDKLSDQIEHSKSLLMRELNENEALLAVETPTQDLETSNPIFVYRGSELIFWSDNRIVPSYSDIAALDTIAYFEKSGWKAVIVKLDNKNTSLQDRVQYICLIPLQYDPAISNKYLKNKWNQEVFENSLFTITSEPSEVSRTISYKGKPLFEVQLADNYKPQFITTKNISFLLMSIGLLIVFYLSALKIQDHIRSKSIIAAFTWFIFIWVVTFLVFKITHFGELWEGIPLLDSRLYASSWFLNNLLDLILFSLFIASFSILINQVCNSKSIVRFIVNKPEWVRILFAGISITLLLYTLTLHFLVIRDIYDNSQISLDITNSLDLNQERIFCLLVVVINSFSIFLFTHTFFRIWLLATKSKSLSILVTLGIGVGVFLIVENRFPVIFLLIVLGAYLILLGLSRIYIHFGKLNYLSLLYLVSNLIFSSIIGSYSITKMEQKRDREEMLRFGNEQLLDADIFGEFLMNEAVQKIKDDPFIANSMISPFVSKDIVSRKITQIYLDPYLDRYDIQIILYNQNGNPLSINPNVLNYQRVHDIFSVSENATGFDDIYLVRNFKSDLYKQYYAFIEIKRFESVVGYILIDFNQKRTVPDNVYPELLVDSRIIQPPGDISVSYAVYTGQNLLNSVGEFNYQNDFDVDELNYEKIYSQGKHIKGSYHVAIDADTRTLVISSRSHSLSETLSNFSFLFLSLIILLGLVFMTFIFSRQQDSPIRGFASKIQLYLNLAFIMPLLIVSVTTLSLLSSQSRREIEEEYRQKGNKLADNIQGELNNFQFEPTQGRDHLVEKIRTTASVLNTDADLYNLTGGLIVSTQTKIYDKGLKSKYIDPEALSGIVGNSLNYMVEETRVGDLNYNVTYVPVKTLNTGRLIGILGLPFFNFKSILEAQQIDVLTNILNIFSLLFLVLLIISYFVSQRLVIPLRMIAEKLTGTSLTGYNPPIEWHTKDEIGLLVEEYNKMIRNLEQSKEQLARTQKELAWREIARQVAHEIKNPLTPMKLTLQQLQRRLLGTASLETKDVEKPVGSLLYQVDVLRDIATSFSAFAKMPIPKMERFNLVELLNTTFSLHKNIENSSVEFQSEGDSINVMGDVKLMGRITTNIILNAIQAADGKQVHITGKVMVTGAKALISIKDDGPGIDEKIRDKIFLPSFSTKAEGSGIGLAIAKHGIEQSGGQIWFETETGSGTTFFIELPLAEE